MLTRLLNTAVGVLLLWATDAVHAAEFNVGMTRDGDAYISLSGILEEKDGIVFGELVTAWKDTGHLPTQLILDSPGGNAAAHFAIVDIVLRHNMTTIVNVGALCNSACVTILLAGKRRHIASKSYIAVHRVGLENHKETAQTRQGTQRLAQLYRLLGAPEVIVNKMLTTPPAKAYYLTEAEKAQLRAVPKEWAGERIHLQVINPPDRSRVLPQTQRQQGLMLDKKGVTLIQQKDYGQAIRVLKRASILYPANEAILRHLGIAYSRARKYEKAKTALTATLYLNNNQPVVWRELGLTLSALGDAEWASDCLMNYWLGSTDKDKANQQLLAWQKKRPGSHLSKAAKNARQRLGGD